jgi:4-carboxymuconolactone decarboxylase
MPRIAVIDSSDNALTAALIERIKSERGGKLLLLYKVLLNSPAIAEGWLALLTAVRSRTALSPALRELVILRIAVLNRAPYEFAAHTPFALAEGVAQGWIDNLVEGSLPAGLAPEQRAALLYTDAMTSEIEVSAPIFDEVRTYFDDSTLLELTVTIAGYNMVSRVLTALKIEEEH